MSELRYVIDICGLEEGIRCAICENPMHTDNGCDGNCKYNEKAFKRITDLLDKRIELLPIAPEPHWIPCSERLPSKEGEYLITNNAGGVKNIEVDTLLHYEDGEPFWFYSQNPIAWRELPVPFGEE